MASLNLPSGEHEQERPEDKWTKFITSHVWAEAVRLEGTAFEFGRNFFRFKDKSGKTITIKITSK